MLPKVVLILLLILGVVVGVQTINQSQGLKSKATNTTAAEDLNLLRETFIFTQKDGKEITCALDKDNQNIIVCPTGSLEINTVVKNPQALSSF